MVDLNGVNCLLMTPFDEEGKVVSVFKKPKRLTVLTRNRK